MAGIAVVAPVLGAVEITMACVSLNSSERPMMTMIVTKLKETLATQIAMASGYG